MQPHSLQENAVFGRDFSLHSFVWQLVLLEKSSFVAQSIIVGTQFRFQPLGFASRAAQIKFLIN